MLTIRPSTLHEANRIVEEWHRHSRPVRGCRFTLAAVNSMVVGVAIVGRPVAPELQDEVTAEVLRVCTNGYPNACSALYGACWRAWRAMGGRRLYTYTLQSEPGNSLRAAGARVDAVLDGRANWSTARRPRPQSTEPCPPRLRWIWTL